LNGVGRSVLALSAVAIGVGQIGLAIAPSVAVYVVAWLVIGLGMGAGLYHAAFATLGRLYGREARASITTLTLFGGFASTVCWPLSAFMASELGWRGACLAYAGLQFAVALPVYLMIIPWDEPPVHEHAHSGDGAVIAAESPEHGAPIRQMIVGPSKARLTVQ
jgi:MFS family permease